MTAPVLRRTRRLWLSRQGWRRRGVFWGGGLLVGLVAVGFALLADRVQEESSRLIAVWPWLPLIALPAGMALSVALTRTLFPGAQGSGIPQAIAARQIRDPVARGRLVSLRLAVGKVVLTLLGLAVGASVGREGPTVQVGASLMHTVGRVFQGRFPGLLLAGGAAGVAAAFNTPLAGIVFAIEEMGRTFEVRTAGLVLAAVIVAGIAPLGIQGDYLYFGQSTARMIDWGDWLLVPLAGLVGGMAGGQFSRLTLYFARGGVWEARFWGWLAPRAPRSGAGQSGGGQSAGAWLRTRPTAFAALCGLVLAVIGIATGGATYGTGYAQARALLENGGGVPWLYGPLKLLATLISSISGIPGGIFSPSLSVGAGVGAELGDITHALAPHLFTHASAWHEIAVLVGMAAYFSGVVQAPVTAFVIVLEMTGNHGLAVPLMAASLIGTGAARMTGGPALYHALAEGFLPKTTPADP